MADEQFHFSNGEILMKETCFIFLSGRKDIVHDGKFFWVKKKRKEKNRRSGTLKAESKLPTRKNLIAQPKIHSQTALKASHIALNSVSKHLNRKPMLVVPEQ